MSKHKIIEPRLETPLPGVRSETRVTRLPESLVSEQVQRLKIIAGVAAGLWVYGLAMDGFVRPATVGAAIPPSTIVIEIASIVFSGLMLVYVHFGKCTSQQKIDSGLLFIIANAVAVALLNTWDHAVTQQSLGLLSWNTVTILVSAMIMPATPGRMLVASLIAATTDPVAVWLAHLRGIPTPSVVETLVLFMPNYACAAVATLPATVLQRLGRKLRQAQDLGSYHLMELLGRGGMGEVWRARHRLLAREAAIKLVRPELLGARGQADAQEMLVRFEREAQATAALTSPHTIRVFDFGVTADQTFYYVMELLEGRDLETLVRDSGPVPAERVLFLLRQAAASLAEAHARGIVHRDITPANIYVCRMGLEYDFVKVLDFGLVTTSDRSMEHTLLTGVHSTAGTPAFMAPEIVLDGEVDERADVYALGCVAYYLLTGQNVFEGETPMKMFVQHLHTLPVPPSERAELPIPAELDALVLACLEKNPQMRPQNASEVLRMIDEIGTGRAWGPAAARAWWAEHLVDLAEPAPLVQ
jgi:eukaryotic-like serine/threonine-protein kinase